MLTASADEERRARRLGEEELVQRLFAVAGTGLWDDYIAPYRAEAERRTGHPLERGPVERRKTRIPRRRRRARSRELVALLDATIQTTVMLYRELEPRRARARGRRARTGARATRGGRGLHPHDRSRVRHDHA